MLLVVLSIVAIALAILIGFLFVDYGDTFAPDSFLIGLLVCGFFAVLITGIVHNESTPSGYTETNRWGVNSVVYLASSDSYLIEVDLGDGVKETVRTSDVVVSDGAEKVLIDAKGYHDAWHVLPWDSGSNKTQQTLVVPSDMVKVVMK